MAEEATKKRSATDRIREKLLGASGERLKLELSGEAYLLVAPTQKKRGQIQQAALKLTPAKDDKGKPTGEFDANMDNTELKVRSLAACLRDPETDQLVFKSEADIEALRETPVDATADALMNAAVKLLNPSQEEIEKNSSAAPGVSSSTASPQS